MNSYFRTAYLSISEKSLTHQVDFIVFDGDNDQSILENMNTQIEHLKHKYPNHAYIVLSPLIPTDTIGDMPFVIKITNN